MKLYHYTTLDALKSILHSDSFNLSSFCNSNDYKEKKWKVFNDGRTVDDYKYFSTCARQTPDGKSFMGFANGMLWYFYAQNHSGVCIELDSNKLDRLEKMHSGFVNYKDGVCHVDEQDAIDYLMEKRTCWNGENEYRYVFSADSLDISNFSQYVTAIYFGANMDWNSKEPIENYIKIKEKMLEHGSSNCNYYRMWFDANDGRTNRIDFELALNIEKAVKSTYRVEKLG